MLVRDDHHPWHPCTGNPILSWMCNGTGFRVLNTARWTKLKWWFVSGVFVRNHVESKTFWSDSEVGFRNQELPQVNDLVGHGKVFKSLDTSPQVSSEIGCFDLFTLNILNLDHFDLPKSASSWIFRCYWHLDTRPEEHRRMGSSGWMGRLKLAARAIDLRLKAEPGTKVTIPSRRSWKGWSWMIPEKSHKNPYPLVICYKKLLKMTSYSGFSH